MSRLRALTVELDLVGAEFAQLHQLHPTDVRALIALVESEREEIDLTPGMLARQLQLDTSSVTALVDRLERRGHLERERDPADRRRVLLHLTPVAEQLGQAFFGPLLAAGGAVVQDFDRAEVLVIERFLTAMTAAVSEGRQVKNSRMRTDGCWLTTRSVSRWLALQGVHLVGSG